MFDRSTLSVVRRAAARMLLLPALVSAPLAAQQAMPGRPPLPRGADPNDWESYFDLGVSLEPRMFTRAHAAFEWAHRLDPSRAEPLFGLWAAFHFKDIGRFERYLSDDPRVMSRPEVIRADSLRWRSLTRNPFVHRGLEVLLYAQLPGRWRSDPATRALLEYATGEIDAAANRFSVVEHRRASTRSWAVMSFVAAGRLDVAAAHLDTLLRRARVEEATRLVRPDESKETYEFALALLHQARGRREEARGALERALVENAAFAPARVQLAALATEAGRHAEAVEELRQVVELTPEDGVAHLRLGVALLTVGDAASALAALRQAGALEPYFAEVDLHLGRALQGTGDPTGAAEASRRYLERAPRRETALRAQAERLLQALGG